MKHYTWTTKHNDIIFPLLTNKEKMVRAWREKRLRRTSRYVYGAIHLAELEPASPYSRGGGSWFVTYF